MPAYATRAELVEYVDGVVIDDTAAADRLLERASRDIDAIFGPLAYYRSGTFPGFKAVPTTLADVDADALARATAIQAAPRASREADGSREAGVRRVKGPDYEVEYTDQAAAGSTTYSPE